MAGAAGRVIGYGALVEGVDAPAALLRAASAPLAEVAVDPHAELGLDHVQGISALPP